MAGVKAVVFDIGNVLIEWQPERFYDAKIGQAARKKMFAAIDLHGMNERVDRGEVFRDVIYETAEQFPEWRTEIQMWHDDWIEMAAPVIQLSVDLLRKLRDNGMPVLALTNFGVESFELACKHYPFLNEFDQRYVSGQMKVTKPAGKIYQMLEEKCGFAPSELLFTDDRQENIDAAAQRGWQTHLFQSAEGWRDRLDAEGLL